ncbi:MAG: rhomboid family intramembrane serine protease [Devosia sp.]
MNWHVPQMPRRDEQPAGPMPPRQRTGPREPVFALPGAVTAMIVLLVVIHVARLMIGYTADIEVLMLFAFMPARYVDTFGVFPGGVGADVWTFVTYALLHGGWMHLIMNVVWLVAFGAAVARRFGAVRFWVFSAAAAAGGAGLHLAVHFGEAVPVVGASAAIAGLMAAAARFVFDTGGPLGFAASRSVGAYRRPALSLMETFRNRRALVFIIVFFAINLFIGVGGNAAGGVAIAWEAHLGGFITGLLAFKLFDPVPR